MRDFGSAIGLMLAIEGLAGQPVIFVPKARIEVAVGEQPDQAGQTGLNLVQSGDIQRLQHPGRRPDRDAVADPGLREASLREAGLAKVTGAGDRRQGRGGVRHIQLRGIMHQAQHLSVGQAQAEQIAAGQGVAAVHRLRGRRRQPDRHE